MSGEAQVTLVHFPFEGCPCGKRRRHGVLSKELAKRLVENELPKLNRERWPLRRRRCSSCDARLMGHTQPHEFSVEAQSGAHRRYWVTATLRGLVCEQCQTAQVDGDDESIQRDLDGAVRAALAGFKIRGPRRRLGLRRASNLDAELLGRAQSASAGLAVDGER